MLWSETQQILYFIGLTVPWEDSADAACQKKTIRYTELAKAVEQAAALDISASPVKFGGLLSVLTLLGKLAVKAVKATDVRGTSLSLREEKAA